MHRIHSVLVEDWDFLPGGSHCKNNCRSYFNAIGGDSNRYFIITFAAEGFKINSIVRVIGVPSKAPIAASVPPTTKPTPSLDVLR